MPRCRSGDRLFHDKIGEQDSTPYHLLFPEGPIAPVREEGPGGDGGVGGKMSAAGGRGMVGGQVLDMAGEGRALGLTEVEELQRLKTGALIRAAVEMGCAVAGGAEEQREALCRYADCLRLAFRFRTISWT